MPTDLIATIATLVFAITAAQAPVPERATAASLAARIPDAKPALAGRKVETAHLTMVTNVSDERLAPGARFALILDVSPKPTMHVYAPVQKEYMPISLTLDPDESVTVHAPVYPHPEKFFFAPLKETQLVYTRPFRIVQDLTLNVTPSTRDRARAAGASMTITGTLRYQACDHRVCYVPREVPLSWTVALKPLEK